MYNSRLWALVFKAEEGFELMKLKLYWRGSEGMNSYSKFYGKKLGIREWEKGHNFMGGQGRLLYNGVMRAELKEMSPVGI